MTSSLTARLNCALKALIFLFVAWIVFYNTLEYLKQGGIVVRGMASVPPLVGYLSIVMLAFVGICWVVASTVRLVHGLFHASFGMRMLFVAVLLIWLVSVSVLPVWEAIEPADFWLGRNVLGALISSLFLFGTPAVLSYLGWSALEERPTVTVLHRVTGSLACSLLPAIGGIIAMEIDWRDPDNFTIGAIAGTVFIPAALAFAYRCTDDQKTQTAP